MSFKLPIIRVVNGSDWVALSKVKNRSEMFFRLLQCYRKNGLNNMIELIAAFSMRIPLIFWRK